MQCPVCGGRAENLTPNTLEGVVVGCGECGDYRISGVAFHGLMRLATEQRRATLANARQATKHGWPVIARVSSEMR